MRIQVHPILRLLTLYVVAPHKLHGHGKVANEVVFHGALQLVEKGQEVSQRHLLLVRRARLHRQVEVVKVRLEVRPHLGLLRGRREFLHLALLVLLLVVDFARHLITCVEHVNRE